MAALTKTEAQLLEWTLLDDTGGTEHIETGEVDASTAIETILHIEVCSADANASTAATSVEVIVYIQSGSANDEWHVLTRLDAAAASTAAGTIAEVTGGSSNIVTYAGTSIDAGDGMFIYESGTIANSEIIWPAEGASPADLMDPPVRNHAASTPYFELNAQFNVTLPQTVSQAKVLFNNRDADATYAVRVRVTKVTAIS